ncbi:MAG: c-type cytochrome [Silicimonas sp.]|jgi:mono/diheme cytochrome c family protein|nr:c-type cytochrome [Silicimonas sp.]
MKRLVLLAVCLAGPVWAEGDPVAGEGVFQTFCSACHGTDAQGNGPMSGILTVEPPDLTALALSNDGVFPVFRVVRQIDGRDPMLAHGGEMPLFGALFDFPDGSIASETGQPIITAQPIADVAAWLESVQD